VGSDEAVETKKEEDNWTVVLGSAHCRRKMLGKKKRALNVAAVWRSDRLAGKDTEEFVDTTTKAVKLRELKDTLKGCSAKFQAHVSGNKLLQKLTSPMSLKNVCALIDAAFGKTKKKVLLGADD
jgi:hypothetical protein